MKQDDGVQNSVIQVGNGMTKSICDCWLSQGIAFGIAKGRSRETEEGMVVVIAG